MKATNDENIEDIRFLSNLCVFETLRMNERLTQKW